jgi:hypothetical protein
MYHRFAKSLKPSNRTLSAMASNPAGLGHISLECFDFYGLQIGAADRTTPQIQSDPEGGIPSGSWKSWEEDGGRKMVGRSVVG